MGWLVKILALIQTLQNNALAQKIYNCVVTQSGWSNILSCITSNVQGSTTPGTADHAVVEAILGHAKEASKAA